jgi:hypothetical protein
MAPPRMMGAQAPAAYVYKKTGTHTSTGMASTSQAAKTVVAQAAAKAIVLPSSVVAKKSPYSLGMSTVPAKILQTPTGQAALADMVAAQQLAAAVQQAPYQAYSGGGGGSADDGGGQAPDPGSPTPDPTQTDPSQDVPDPSQDADPSDDRSAQLQALFQSTDDSGGYTNEDDQDAEDSDQRAATHHHHHAHKQVTTDDQGQPTGYYQSDDEDADDAAFNAAVDSGAGTAPQASNYPGRTDDTEFVPAQSFGDSEAVHGEDGISGLSCYVSRGVLTCMGLVKTRYGNLPIVKHIRVPSDTPEGPVEISGEGEADATVFGEMQNGADYETMRRDAESQVIRAREGDENAMAMIRAVTEAAKAGSQRARVAHGIISAYIKTHPVKDGADPIGFDPLPPFVTQSHRAAVRLANGPTITGDRFNRMVAAFAGESSRGARIVQFGAEKFQHEDALAEAKAALASHAEAALLELGKIIGHALALQKVRQPGAPIAAFDKNVAWELGE